MAAAAPAASRAVTTADNVPPPLVTLDQLKIDFAHVEKAVADLVTESAGIPPVIEDEEDLALATELAGKLTRAAKRCEAIRKEQNQPHQDAEKVINGLFKHDLTVRLDTEKAKLEKISGAYLKKKAAREQKVRDEQAAEARKKADAAAATLAETVKSGDVPAVSAAVTQSNTLASFAARATAAAAAPTSAMASTTTEAGNATLVDNWTFDELDINTVDLAALRPFLPQTAIEQALRAFIKAGRREIAGARIFNDNKARFRT
jgi:hypothetical protein